MKIIIIVSAILASRIWAGNIANEIPQNIMEKFHNQFPDIQNVTWKNTEENAFETIIIENENLEIDVFYNNKAKCIEINRKITFDLLPIEFQSQIKKEYGNDFHVAQVLIIDKENSKPVFFIRIKQGKLVYEVEFEDNVKADLAFHKKFIK